MTSQASAFDTLLGLPGVCALVSAVMIGAVAMEIEGRAPAADPTAHHDLVRDLAASKIPFSVGDWFARSLESPPAAVQLLHPNAMEGRAFVNSRTGETANLLFVHCSDARDILGHFPPVCYPAHGMTLESSQPREWKVAGLEVTGMRYRFSGKGAAPAVSIDNFMILPTGRFGRDMDAVQLVAKDRRVRQFGVAQVQLITSGTLSDARRDEIFDLIVSSVVPVIRGAGMEMESDRE